MKVSIDIHADHKGVRYRTYIEEDFTDMHEFVYGTVIGYYVEKLVDEIAQSSPEEFEKRVQTLIKERSGNEG